MKKVLPILVVLGVAGVCAFGFATVGTHTEDAALWRTTYGVVGAVALVVAARMLQKEGDT